MDLNGNPFLPPLLPYDHIVLRRISIVVCLVILYNIYIYIYIYIYKYRRMSRYPRNSRYLEFVQSLDAGQLELRDVIIGEVYFLEGEAAKVV